MRIVCAWGQHNYGDPSRGESYEYVNFLPALKALGHQVSFIETWNRSRYADFAALNGQLLRTVEALRPDLLFVVLLSYEIWVETLDLIRGAVGCPVLNWGTDDSWKYRSFSRFIAPHVDRYATTYENALQQFLGDGIANVVLTQWAANSATLREPLPAADCEHAVSFVGSAYGRRPQWIAALQSRGLEVECFGHGWSNGPVQAERIPEIIRNSVISLNFSEAAHGAGAGRQVKARVFEVPGNGGFLLTQDAPGLDRFYAPGCEIETFNRSEELAAKVEHYLANTEARDRIARAGHARTRQHHTYERRFTELLAGIAPKEPRDVRAEVARQQMDTLARRHRTTWWQRVLARALAAPGVALWGPRRGRRAARRMMFELSWRLAGEHTYTSRGLPGRLFYAES